MTQASGTPITALGIAEILVDVHGEVLRYCAEWDEWFYWNQARWSRDSEGSLSLYLKSTLRMLEDEANQQKAFGRETKLFKFERQSALESIIALARLDLRVRVRPEALDSD